MKLVVTKVPPAFFIGELHGRYLPSNGDCPMSFSNHKPLVLMIFTAFVYVFGGLQRSGCASDSYAAKGAKQGAAQGAAAGAVGGLISALVFGGDPVDRAALAECRHQDSIDKAMKAQKSKNPNYRLAYHNNAEASRQNS
jgi:hypothetical protein